MKSSARLFTFQACASLFAFSHTAIAAESSAFGNNVAAQRDGKIVVAGYAEVGRGDQFALVRYNSDGSLDTSLTLKDHNEYTLAGFFLGGDDNERTRACDLMAACVCPGLSATGMRSQISTAAHCAVPSCSAKNFGYRSLGNRRMLTPSMLNPCGVWRTRSRTFTRKLVSPLRSPLDSYSAASMSTAPSLVTFSL